MPTGRKIAIAALIIVAVGVLIAAILVPHLVDVDRYRPELAAGIERGTGRSVEIGRLSLSVLPVVAVRADNVAIGNPPGFPQGHILEIGHVYADLDARALLSRQIVVRSLEFERPVVKLLSTADGRWNTEGPPRAQVRPAAWDPEPAAPLQPIARVRLEHGVVTASYATPSGAAGPPVFEADDVALELDDVNPEALGLDLAPASFRPPVMAAPGLTSGLLNRAGGPTWFRPVLFQKADAGMIGPPPGALAAHGAFSAGSARFNAVQATGLKSAVELYAGGLMLRQFALELAGGHVSGDLAWNSAAQPASFAAQLTLANIDLGRLLAEVPGANNRITGTVEGQLKLTGLNLPSPDPLANKEGAGRITVHNGTLPTLQLNRNLMALMKNILVTRPESGDPSSFQSISADLEISGGEIHSRQISIVGNGMDIDASGALALAGAGRLDYEGVTKMAARHNGFEGIVAGLLGSRISADGKIHVPFTLTGTLDQPRFALKNSPLFH
jgi:AsmA-like C-terminal region/AsmA family